MRGGGRVVTVLSRHGCHLCDEAIYAVERVVKRLGASPAGAKWSMHEVDVDDLTDTDEPVYVEGQAMRAEQVVNRFGLEVPVVVVDEKPIMRIKVDERALEAVLLEKSKGILDAL
jgi:hypothetical protein